MNSPWGVIAHIIKETGWQWDYVLRGVSWVNIRMMLADMPHIRTHNTEGPIPEATDDDIDDLQNG